MLIEERLKPLPYVKHFYTQSGGTTTNPAGVNEATITVALVDKDQRGLSANQVAAAWRHLFADIPGATFTIKATSNLPSISEKPLKVYVRGPDIVPVLHALIENLREVIAHRFREQDVQLSNFERAHNFL